MRLRRHFHSEEQTGIDLAPMLDFVMNLLIFFIITAVFSKELSLAVNRPGEKVTLIVRPGFQWGQLEDVDETPPPITIDWEMLGATLELEAEWMVADKLSISASYGAGYYRLRDNGDPTTSRTYVGTLGTNFTELGFHVYLW